MLVFLRHVGRRICRVPPGPGFRYSRSGDSAVAVVLVAPYGRLRSASACPDRGIPITSSGWDGFVLLPALFSGGPLAGLLYRTRVRPMVVVVYAFADEGEPPLCLLGHVGEEGIPIFLGHFDLEVDAKPKHTPS